MMRLRVIVRGSALACAGSRACFSPVTRFRNSPRFRKQTGARRSHCRRCRFNPLRRAHDRSATSAGSRGGSGRRSRKPLIPNPRSRSAIRIAAPLGEALSLYEEAFRSKPGLSGLNTRIELARIHYISAAAMPTAASPQLVATRRTSALDLYSEVLNKIESHYVVDPDWKHIVDHGTLDFEVALGEPAFVASSHLQATPQEVDDSADSCTG